MKYSNMVQGTFLKRPNRFIAHVLINGREEIAHVKNTGRCRELLLPGARVILQDHGPDTKRKTRYSLISVYKEDMLVNMDSQAPNRVVMDALVDGKIQGLGAPELIKGEQRYGDSRFDIYYRDGDREGFIEIKGVTLEVEGLSKFPDAPTVRGTRHIMEMISAVQEGYEGNILFLIQMKGPKTFTPNRVMDPAFGEALDMAISRGVRVHVYDSMVTFDSIQIGSKIQYREQVL
ncbi:MAG: DNA/RNA nuclease SfsA [Gudongella sp.]|nr:DNA/RNA nuclease SfsA [Gudongella sp.]